jgi:hypothetical protein
VAEGALIGSRCLPSYAHLSAQRDVRVGAANAPRRSLVLCNIAEGQGRWTRRDYHRFLIDARGSTLELEAQVVISEDLEYLSHDQAATLIGASEEIARMLNGLLRHVRSTM